MLKYILGIVIEKLISAISEAISDYMKLQKLKKEKKAEVKEVLSEKDPVVKAKRITDLLRSS